MAETVIERPNFVKRAVANIVCRNELHIVVKMKKHKIIRKRSLFMYLEANVVERIGFVDQ